MKRQKNLTTEKAVKIEAVRTEVTTEHLQEWFEDLKEVVQKYDILPENIYNMDETGFNIGDSEARHVVVDRNIQSRYQAQPVRQEWVTAIECICADGSGPITPLIIFTSETFVRQWIPTDFDSTWKFSNNSRGWTSDEHGLKWLKQCFELATREKADGRYRLLIYDGHGSHCSLEFLAYALEHKILAFLLVLHSSHLAQPLDATIFNPLKRILSGRTTPLFQLGITRIQKAEWIEAYYQAYHQVFSAKNIKAGFSSTSIYPFNPDKVLDRIPSMPVLALVTTRAPTPASPTTPELPVASTSTSTTETTSFPTQVLTSSPSDFSVLQAANSVLNHMVELRNYCQSLLTICSIFNFRIRKAFCTHFNPSRGHRSTRDCPR